MKYYKYFMASALISLSGCFLTSCDDDDNTIVEVLPEEFTVELSSINVAWNETEGVVDFGANAKWEASAVASWITVEPTKGGAGDYRLFMTFEPNPYLLPRTAQVEIKCGEQRGHVSVTQGGCQDESLVEQANAQVEVESLDYATGSVSFGNFMPLIEGNLGMNKEQLATALDEGTGLEFFMVQKNGDWVRGGTSGTPYGAWLDNNLNVTSWDGEGYPYISTAIEMYGNDGEPEITIIRAPGVPENTVQNLKFGLALENDLSKYVIFNLEVTYPEINLDATLVAELDYTLDIEINDSYAPTMLTFDYNAVCSALGCSNLGAAKVVTYNADGEAETYTGGGAVGGYWYDTKGNVCKWGEGAGFFIEYDGEDEDNPDSKNSLRVGNFPNVEPFTATTNFNFVNNGKRVQLNITIVASAPEVTGPEEVVELGQTVTATLDMSELAEYAPVVVEFDLDKVLQLLGAPDRTAIQPMMIDGEGNFISYTGNNGYWFNAEGGVDSWGNGAFYIEWHGDEAELEEEGDDRILALGYKSGCPNLSDIHVPFGFLYGTKLVTLDVVVNVVGTVAE